MKPARAGLLLTAALVLTAATSCGNSGASSSSGASTAGGGSSDSPQTVRFQQYPASSNNWIPYLAQAEGFLQKNGINASFVSTSSGNQTAAALASGSADLGQLDLTLTGPYIAKGTAFQIGFANSLANWSILANRKSPLAKDAGNLPALLSDLAGKNLGVIALGSSSYYYMQNLVATGGGSPDKATYTATGSNVASVAALQGNRVDAAVVDPSGAWPLTQSGACCVNLFDFSQPPASISQYPDLKSLTAIPSGAYWGTKGWLDSHKDALARVQRAMAQTDVWMHDPANLGKLVTDLQKYGLPKSVPAASYQDFVKALLPLQETYFSTEAAQAEVAFVKARGIVKTAIDPASLLAPGVPQSAEAVKQLANG